MRIEVYGRPMCDQCEIAVNILEQYFIPYEYYNVEMMQPSEVIELVSNRAPQANKVPVIFIEGRYIGDLNELKQFCETRRESEIKLDIRRV